MDFKSWIEQKATKTFIILIVIQITYLMALFIADAVVNIEDVSDFTNEKSLDDYYKWTVLFLFQIGDCYYVFNAIYRCNVLELFAFIIIEFITFGCTFARFYNLYKEADTTGLLVLAIFDYIYLFYSFCIVVLSCVCYNSFYEVFVFKNVMKVGASLERQGMYKNYSNFSAFMKLYFLISLSTFITFFFFFDSGPQNQSAFWYLYLADCSVILLQILSIYIGWKALRDENILFFNIYLVSVVFVQVYILTKTIYYIVYNYSTTKDIINTNADTYTIIIVFGTTLMCFIIMIFDFYYAFLCKAGFGNGLKDALKSSITETGQELGESGFNSDRKQ